MAFVIFFPARESPMGSQEKIRTLWSYVALGKVREASTTYFFLSANQLPPPPLGPPSPPPPRAPATTASTVTSHVLSSAVLANFLTPLSFSPSTPTLPPAWPPVFSHSDIYRASHVLFLLVSTPSHLWLTVQRDPLTLPCPSPLGPMKAHPWAHLDTNSILTISNHTGFPWSLRGALMGSAASEL